MARIYAPRRSEPETNRPEWPASGFSLGKRIKRSGFGTNRAASEAVLSGCDGAKRRRRGFVGPTRRSGPGGNGQPERARFSPAGDGASWPRARLSCGAEERPRGRTMDRSGRRWGFSPGSEPTGAVFSAEAGLCLSEATMAAPAFGHEAAIPAQWSTSPGLCLSTPWRTNRVAPCSAAIAVDGQKRGRDEKITAPPPRPSPKGAGVSGAAALRGSPLQAFPRLPRLGQSPRVTSNPVKIKEGPPLSALRGIPRSACSFPNSHGISWERKEVSQSAVQRIPRHLK